MPDSLPKEREAHWILIPSSVRGDLGAGEILKEDQCASSCGPTAVHPTLCAIPKPLFCSTAIQVLALSVKLETLLGWRQWELSRTLLCTGTVPPPKLKGSHAAEPFFPSMISR